MLMLTQTLGVARALDGRTFICVKCQICQVGWDRVYCWFDTIPGCRKNYAVWSWKLLISNYPPPPPTCLKKIWISTTEPPHMDTGPGYQLVLVVVFFMYQLKVTYLLCKFIQAMWTVIACAFSTVTPDNSSKVFSWKGILVKPIITHKSNSVEKQSNKGRLIVVCTILRRIRSAEKLSITIARLLSFSLS